MNLLPDEVIPTVLCFLVCKDQEVEESARKVDVAFCNSNGYLVEVFNKKIINSCYLLVDNVTEILLYYKYNSIASQIYYLVRNESGLLFIVKKCENFLVVVKCYKNVKDVKVFDFESRGYPQVGIYYIDSNDINITLFTEFDDFELSIENYVTFVESQHNTSSLAIDEENIKKQVLMDLDEKNMDLRNHNKILSDFLSKKLHGMEVFKNELLYEIHNLNMVFNHSLNNKILYFPEFNTSELTVAAINNEFKILKVWQKIFNSSWVLGFELWSRNICDATDVQVILKGKDFSSFSCIFFEANNSEKFPSTLGINNRENSVMAFWTNRQIDKCFLGNDIANDSESENWKFIVNKENRKGNFHKRTKTSLECFRQGCKHIAVLVLRIPELTHKSKFSVAFSFIYNKNEYQTEIFHLKPGFFVSEEYQLFRNLQGEPSPEDLMTSLAVFKKFELSLEMRYNMGISFENVITEKLGYQKCQLSGKKYYIKKSGYLVGTSITINQFCDNFLAWKLEITIRNISSLYVFLEALIDELPMPVIIRLHKNT